MSSNLETSDLPALIAEAEKISVEAGAAFGQLSPAQLNWKRSADQWSIGQCFDHLITANRAYFPLFERIAAGEQKRTLWQRVPLLPRLFGRLLLRAVSPESTRKLKAPKSFKPVASAIDGQIIGRFSSHQGELTRFMKATELLHTDKIIIPSPISSLITYSLLDAYRIMVIHERRHFLQAGRVMKAEEFPRG